MPSISKKTLGLASALLLAAPFALSASHAQEAPPTPEPTAEPAPEPSPSPTPTDAPAPPSE